MNYQRSKTSGCKDDIDKKSEIPKTAVSSNLIKNLSLMSKLKISDLIFNMKTEFRFRGENQIQNLN